MRKIFTTIALGLGLFAAGCSTNPTTGTPEIDPAFIDDVTQALTQVCAAQAFIPTATTVADDVAALFGAGAIPVIQTISGSVQKVAADLCSAVPTAPAASGKLRAALRGSSLNVPVTIGTSAHKVTVVGYQRS